jgi:superoxide reductase
MDRRSFIRIAAAGSAAGIIAPTTVVAEGAGDILRSKMAGGLFYTEDAPGRWEKVAGPHLPNISHATDPRGVVTVSVVNNHHMKQYAHYIVKHVLLDKEFNFLNERMFDPLKDQPISQFKLDGYKGPLYAMSVCNIHDSWLGVVEV